MKNKTTKRAVVLSSFGGVDMRSSVGPDNAAESVNYRIMPDGSLMRRNGFKKMLTLPQRPSCIASVTRSGEKQLLAVAGDRIYALDLDSGSSMALPGVLNDSPDESALVPFKEKLLVFDGKMISLITDTGIELPTGYAPLYGKDWHPLNGGTVYESMNILTKNVRIGFKGVAGIGEICLPENVESLLRIEINGVPLHIYTYDAEDRIISSNYFTHDNINIVVWCTLKDYSSEYQRLNACRSAVSVGGGKTVTVFCNRTPSAEHIVFRSLPVSDEDLEHSRRGFPNSDEFYFPESGAFSVGVGDLPVRTILPFGNRAIVYNDEAAWWVSADTECPECTLLCDGVGCTSPGAAVICDDLPVSLCGDGVYRWAPELEAYNDLIVGCISLPVTPLIDDEFGSRGKLITDRRTRELWLYDPESATRPVLVYDRDARHWYSFSGFSPQIAFYHRGNIGFTCGADVLLFLPDSVCDSPDGISNETITAEFIGGWLDLGVFEDKKSAARLAVKHDGALTLTVEYDSGASETFYFDGSSATSAPSVEHIRLRRERFCQLRFSFASSGKGAGRVYELALHAETDDGVCETQI